MNWAAHSHQEFPQVLPLPYLPSTSIFGAKWLGLSCLKGGKCYPLDKSLSSGQCNRSEWCNFVISGMSWKCTNFVLNKSIPNCTSSITLVIELVNLTNVSLTTVPYLIISWSHMNYFHLIVLYIAHSTEVNVGILYVPESAKGAWILICRMWVSLPFWWFAKTAICSM